MFNEEKHLDNETTEKEQKTETNILLNPKVIIVVSIIILIASAWSFINHQKSKQEEERILTILYEFQQMHPEVEFPAEYDVRKDKKWDSGEMQYRLNSVNNEYFVQIKDDQVVKVFTKKPEAQLYPVVSNSKKEKEKDEVGFFTEIKSLIKTNVDEKDVKSGEEKVDTKEETNNENNNKEYILQAGSLLGEAVTNIEKIQSIVNSEELNSRSIQEITEMLEKSVQLFNEFNDIEPPSNFEEMHKLLVSKWNLYIIGEKDLLESMQKAMHSSSKEKEKEMEVVKEKSIAVGEYSLDLNESMLDFVRKLTGLKKE